MTISTALNVGVMSHSLPLAQAYCKALGLDPQDYVITISNLKPKHGGNRLPKYADDSYLLISTSCTNSTLSELYYKFPWGSWAQQPKLPQCKIIVLSCIIDAYILMLINLLRYLTILKIRVLTWSKSVPTFFTLCYCFNSYDAGISSDKLSAASAGQSGQE